MRDNCLNYGAKRKKENKNNRAGYTSGLLFYITINKKICFLSENIIEMWYNVGGKEH